MKIFQNYGVVDETNLLPGTEGSTFLITSAQILIYMKGKMYLEFLLKRTWERAHSDTDYLEMK